MRNNQVPCAGTVTKTSAQSLFVKHLPLSPWSWSFRENILGNLEVRGECDQAVYDEVYIFSTKFFCCSGKRTLLPRPASCCSADREATKLEDELKGTRGCGQEGRWVVSGSE
jgi:hypothetical protein